MPQANMVFSDKREQMEFSTADAFDKERDDAENSDKEKSGKKSDDESAE